MTVHPRGNSRGATRRRTRAWWRAQTWLTAVLVLAAVVLANHLARAHLRFEIDLSEDQLYAPSPIGRRMVSELDDVLRVQAYFTGNVELGVVQIAKRRLLDQLEEYAEAAGGRLELTYADPNASSEARAEAEALGIAPYALGGVQGTSRVSQDIWLGLVLRYRGREAALPFVLPQTLEYAFLSSLRKLTREEEVTVGFLVRDGKGGSDEFNEARGLLGEQYRLREVLDLETGEPVPDDVSVLVVARPLDLHPRAVFAVDQFLQRGGRALVLADRVSVDLTAPSATVRWTGLERVFEAWGVRVTNELVWDAERCNKIKAEELLDVGGEPSTGRRVSIPFPLWPNVAGEALARETPATAQLPGLDLFWAHALQAREVDGLAATELAASSARSYLVPPTRAAEIDPRTLAARTIELYATGAGEPRALALSLAGRFPSAFEAGAPEPWDPVAAALGDEDPTATTDEPVLSAAAETQVVVVGDADWAASGKFLTDRNRFFLVNLVAWLALEDELIALRARMPVERTLDDFVEDERRALGLVGPEVRVEGEEEHAIARLEAQAAERAARRRWLAMGAATGGSLAVTALAFLLWRAASARALRRVLPAEARP